MTDAEQKAFAQGRAAGLEEAAKKCDEIHMDYRDQYKGRGKYHPANPRRADIHCDGMSDGACECAEAIRSLSPTPSDAGKDDARDADLDEERENFEKWFSAKYHNRLSRNMPDGSYNDPVAYNFFIGWRARASFQQSAILQLMVDKWVVVEQAVIELPGKRNQLGHTLFSDSKLFNSSEEASEYIKNNDLPLGWVRAKVSHLFDSAALPSLEVIGKGEKG